MYKHYGSNDNS